jgi:hypothetical protein
MTKRDGSKARASGICIRPEHLLWMTEMLPEKMARGAYFGGKNRNSNVLP